MKPSFGEVKTLARQLTCICEGVLIRAGPFLKESIYQTLLIHELNLKNIKSSREVVFNYTFRDSTGNDILLGNNQCLRSDIELPEQSGILEVKSSSTGTKAENLWQLRNYLEQRPDRSWGTVLNFVSKFDNKSSPKVTCDILFKVGADEPVAFDTSQLDNRSLDTETYSPTNTLQIETSLGEVVTVNKYMLHSLDSKLYPSQSDIFIDDNSDIDGDQ